jgi:hypothetical protein
MKPGNDLVTRALSAESIMAMVGAVSRGLGHRGEHDA